MTRRKHDDLQKHPPRLRPAGRLWHSEVPGPLWNGTRRVGAGQIRAYCRVVAREFRPRGIILFGSYVTGAATADSDVDLVVLMPFRMNRTARCMSVTISGVVNFGCEPCTTAKTV